MEETKVCQNCKNYFVIDASDFGFYEKIQVPPPTFCPECRSQRRLAWRNDFVFYSRTCDFCKRKVISLYSPENSQPIFCNKCWWGDGWDPKIYQKEFDESVSFFEQFAKLRESVPAISLMNDNGIGSENCEYTQDLAFSKNCYMVMVAWKISDVMYSCYGADMKDCVDCMGILSTSEGLYESMYSEKSFGCRNIYNSTALVDCYYCYDCSGCQDCFLCVGLRNKKYCIKNIQYSEKDYKKILDSYNLNKWTGTEKAKAEFEKFILDVPRKFASLKNCVDCTGDNLSNSKNAKKCFHARGLENSRYIEGGDGEKDSYDLSIGGELSECYEGLTPDHSNRAIFTNYVWKSFEVFYSEFCHSCKNCFGCVGLKHAEYCILNKQYSKEEYFSLRDKIIECMKKTGEWGEFFPVKYSPFAYNETVAQIAFPLSKQEVLNKTMKWRDDVQKTVGQTTLLNVSDDIDDITNDITNEILECLECQRNYKIILNELIFYKKWRIPIPRKCFFCRLKNRFEIRTPSKLWHRKCMCNKDKHFHGAGKCEIEFETSYAPDRPEIVYCEKCYQHEVY